MRAYRLLLTALVTALIALSWLPQTNELASAQVDAGLKRALVTFASARVLNGVISTLQGTEVVAQPLGFGVTLSVGQVLDPVNDLVEQFSDLLLTATLVFGVEKFLLTLFGNWAVSALVTAVLGAWLLLYWRQTCPARDPKIQLTTSLFEVQPDTVTCAGGTAGIDMMLSLIRHQHGLQLATQISDWIILGRMRNSTDPQRLEIAPRYDAHNLSDVSVCETNRGT